MPSLQIIKGCTCGSVVCIQKGRAFTALVVGSDLCRLSLVQRWQWRRRRRRRWWWGKKIGQGIRWWRLGHDEAVDLFFSLCRFVLWLYLDIMVGMLRSKAIFASKDATKLCLCLLFFVLHLFHRTHITCVFKVHPAFPGHNKVKGVIKIMTLRISPFRKIFEREVSLASQSHTFRFVSWRVSSRLEKRPKKLPLQGGIPGHWSTKVMSLNDTSWRSPYEAVRIISRDSFLPLALHHCQTACFSHTTSFVCLVYPLHSLQQRRVWLMCVLVIPKML